MVQAQKSKTVLIDTRSSVADVNILLLALLAEDADMPHEAKENCFSLRNMVSSLKSALV